MAIGSVGAPTNNAYFSQSKKATNVSEQTPATTSASEQTTASANTEDKSVIIKQPQMTNEQPTVENELAEPETHYVKSFTYGALGMDKPSEAGENEDNAYSAGQVLKAVGTVGSIIAVFV